MKFPKVLSKERLSLLSKEDRKIYEQEHNSRTAKEWTIFSSPTDSGEIFEDSNIEENNSTFDASEYAKMILEEEMDNMFNELLSEDMSQEEFEEIKDFIINNDESYNENEAIFEVDGLDSGAWIKGLKVGWIGTLVAGTLGALGTGIWTLLVAGKDKYAMEKLKIYMNKLVETVDQGRNKKRPWYSYLVPSKKSRQNIGEYNNSCFRFIQETADRNMTNSVMNAAYKLGYFDAGNMMSISNGAAPQPGGGLQAFNENILSKLNAVVGPGTYGDENQ